jgi:hypothetical protein
MDANVSRVLRLFRLSVPPIFFLLACYVCLGEHVFGLAYVVGKRLKPRLRATLRGLYRLVAAFFAFFIHTYLWYACADEGDEGASLCPRTRFGERHCLAITSTGVLYCGATLLVERWANPVLALDQPTGLRARACAAIGLMLTWIAVADQQLCAHLLLLLFTSRRALVHFPEVEKVYAMFIKLYTVLHMSRILTQQCDAIPKLAVATVAAMAVL